MKTPINIKRIKAEKGDGISIIYYDAEGNKMTRRKDPEKGSLKGSKSWRHNNPGNLVMGGHSREHGAIGSALYITLDENGKEVKYNFAIFPNYEVGRAVMVALLKGPKYVNFTLNYYPRKYTGVPEGKPDTKEAIAYRNFLQQATKLDMTRTIQSLNSDEFNMLIKKMENYEGWHPWEAGEEFVPIQKIIGVKMHKHCITSFLVRDNLEEKWILRDHAIQLAECRILRAVVVHQSKTVYLRPFPKETSFKEMKC